MVLLDVAIGLTFLFVILGLFLTIFQELTASLLGTRSRNLKALIRNLIAEGSNSAQDQPLKELIHHRLIKQILPPEISKLWPSEWIRNLALYFFDKEDKEKFPSYISPERFTTIIIDLVARAKGGKIEDQPAAPLVSAPASKPATGKDLLDSFRSRVDALPDGALKDNLLTLLNDIVVPKKDAQLQLDAIRAAISKWFNDSVDRAAGWYKRRTQSFVFAYALLLAIVLNIDTVHVARTLHDDPVLGSAIVDQAENFVEEVRADEIATEYLTMGSGFADTLLTIAASDADTWADPVKVARLLDDPHRDRLQFVYDHTKIEDSTWPTEPATCNDLTDESERSLRLACLIEVIKQNAPIEGDAPAADDPAADDPATEVTWKLLDKGVYTGAISESLTILRRHSGIVTLDALTAELEEAGLPIGWTQFWERLESVPDGEPAFWLWVQTVFGIVLTALAASLGAPFWFDLLNKFIKLRGSGIIPGRRGDQSGDATNPSAPPGAQPAN